MGRRSGSSDQTTVRLYYILSVSACSSFVQADEACGAHSNVSCGPPRSEASARATLKGRISCRGHFRPQPAENENGAGAEYFGPPHPGAAGRPLARGLSYFALGSKLGQEYSPTHRPNPSLMLGPARRENRSRFSRLKNSRSPKQSPILRPVSASLRLRFRSAALVVARGNSCRIGRVPTGRICPLSGRATNVCAKFVVRAPA